MRAPYIRQISPTHPNRSCRLSKRNLYPQQRRDRFFEFGTAIDGKRLTAFESEAAKERPGTQVFFERDFHPNLTLDLDLRIG